MVVELSDIFIRALAIDKGLASVNTSQAQTWLSRGATVLNFFSVPVAGTVLSFCGTAYGLYDSWDKKRKAKLIADTVDQNLLAAAKLIEGAAERIVYEYQEMIVILSRDDLEKVAIYACDCLISAINDKLFRIPDEVAPGQYLAKVVRSQYYGSNIILSNRHNTFEFFNCCGLQVYGVQITERYHDPLYTISELGYRYAEPDEIRDKVPEPNVPSRKRFFETLKSRDHALSEAIRVMKDQRPANPPPPANAAIGDASENFDIVSVGSAISGFSL